ncbi:Zn-finger protein [Scheffersomyces xylosifermentans]|uniref:Zn-finger protein n=1 Tax=Scheffersomyces xylosifermentans TaxID=1304137 RepID=UPI00315CAE72
MSQSGSTVTSTSPTSSSSTPAAGSLKLLAPAKKSELKVLADGKVMKVQKTRQRKILSCIYCHSKKIKCSRMQPVCNNCEKLGVECKYFINERSHAMLSMDAVASNNAVSTDSNNDAEPYTKVSTPNPIIPELSLNYLNLNFNLQNNPASNQANENNDNDPNNDNINQDQYSFNLSSFTFAHQEGLLASNLPSNVNSPMTQANMPPSLSQTNSTTNINSFFIRNLNSNVDEPAPRAETPSNASKPPKVKGQPNNPGLHNSLNAYSSNPATTINYLYGTNTYYDNEHLLDDLLNHLPSGKERSFELIDRYINSVHLLLPIVVNLSDFLKEHERYWNLESESAPGNNNTNANKASPESTSSTHSGGSNNGEAEFNYLQFYTLYFPILYASTISEFEEYDNLLLNQDINRYLKAFNKICQYYNYPHGIKTIPLLLGNVIIQSTSPNPSTMEMSQIIRYAKFLQMHKDPLISLRINDWEVIKFRRLLWWVIFGLDALTSHNFCLPPVCKFEDFNVLMPEEEEPIFDKLGIIKEKKLNVSILSMNVKFKYDRISSELVYHLHNGLSSDITPNQINEIKGMIIDYFKYIHKSIFRMNQFYKLNPPTTVQEMNLINFIKNHSWSFVDRALMLLHKKILFGDNTSNDYGSDDGKSVKSKGKGGAELENLTKTRGGILSLSQYEDTFGRIQEANIIKNFNNSSISLLRFNQFEKFSYENMHNNLIPSILHNLNDFLKYNDFIKFGKYNWYIKRTIPLDSIILMFIIITVKLKYEFMTLNELCIYVKLINKALFILNRKWFKNEKYKRMLSLTNLTWEFLLKRYNIVELINQYNDSTLSGGANGGRIEFFDYQVTGYMNMNDLFNVMDVPQPIFNDSEFLEAAEEEQKKQEKQQQQQQNQLLHPHSNHHRMDMFSNSLIHTPNLDPSRSQANNKLSIVNNNLSADTKTELIQLNEKIYYDLRNNFVDINDYCAFYSSLENILHELMDYIHKV